MIRRMEGDTQGSTLRARCVSWSSCRVISPATCRATRFAAGIAADSAHESGFEREHGAAAERDQQAAAFDEILNLHKTLIANAAGDVVGFGGHTEVGRLRRFFEGHPAPALGNALDLFVGLGIDGPL